MHRAFQRDAFKLKLETARSLAHVLNTKQTPMQESVKLSAEVLGLGPSFNIIIGIQNIGPVGLETSAISDLALFFHWDDKYYDVKPPLIHVSFVVAKHHQSIFVRYGIKIILQLIYFQHQVPMLVPTVEVKLMAKVEAVSTSGLADVVRVIVFKKKLGQPLLVAMINMPPSEMTVL
jgi:hypothetical protein